MKLVAVEACVSLKQISAEVQAAHAGVDLSLEEVAALALRHCPTTSLQGRCSQQEQRPYHPLPQSPEGKD